MSDLPRGTVTLLFSDIEGSTGLVQRLGRRYADAIAEHRRMMRAAFTAHGGVEVDTQGDAFFAVFTRAQDAVRAAVDAQLALAAHPWPQDGVVTVRVGVHTGEPDLSNDGIYTGLDLTRAARICAASHGGQICVSQTTRDLLGEAVDVRELGYYAMKGVPLPERVYQIAAPGLRDVFPPLRAHRVGNLPTPRTPLVGRGDEVAILSDLVQRSPLVTLTGPGGIGKTRLALEVAHRTAAIHRDGGFFVRLADVADPAAVPAAVADVLEVEDNESAVIDALRERNCILVLDNFERVVAAASFVSDVVERCHRVTIVVTSRERLHLTAETEFAVPPLPERDALTLFAVRAAAASGGAVPAGGDSTVAEICRRLDGLPLAIELAAAHVRLLPPAAILERLEERLRFLTGGARDLPLRQQTLEATIDWSYALLDGDEREALENSAVFTGGFSIDAAAAVTPGGDAIRLLTSLRDKSLVVPRVASDGGARFALLDTIRDYAFARLEAASRAADVQRRHAEFFASLADSADSGLRGPLQPVWLSRLSDEHANLRAALTHARDTGDDDMLLRLAAALWRFWFMRGHVREGRTWLDQALARNEDATSGARSRALGGGAALAVATGDLPRARSLAEKRLDLARALDDDVEIASAFDALANTAAALGELDEATELYARAADYAQRAHAWPELAATMNNLGYLFLLQGDPEQAAFACREAQRRFRELDIDEDYAGAGVNLAHAHLRAGRLAEARSEALESLRAYLRLGHEDGVSYSLDAVAAADAATGALDAAGRLAGAAAFLRENTGTSPPPLERALHEETVRKLRAELAAAEVDGLLAAGAATPLADTVAQLRADGADAERRPAQAGATASKRPS